jgi:hypothetical protein
MQFIRRISNNVFKALYSLTYFTGDFSTMEERKTKNSGVNPPTHRPLAPAKRRVRSASAPAEPAMDSEAILQQQAYIIGKLCENHRRLEGLLNSLLSRRNKEPSPAPFTSMAADIAPTPTTSATLTTGENFQDASDPSGDCQQITASLAADLVRSPPLAGTVSRRLRFTNSVLKNPIRFLDEFQMFCSGVRFTPAEKLLAVICCLDREAREWAEYRKSSWETFEDFRRDFLRHYWSEEVQMTVFQQIGEKPYDPTRGTTMSDYFILRVNQLRGLTLPFPEGFLVASLMKLFPAAVQSSWLATSQRERTIDRAVEFLCQQSRVFPSRQPRTKPRHRNDPVTTSQTPTSRPTISAMSQEPPFNSFSIPPPNFTLELQEDMNQGCLRPTGKVPMLPSTFPTVAFIPEGVEPMEPVSCDDQWIPCGTTLGFLPSLSRRQRQYIYSRGRRMLYRMGWRPFQGLGTGGRGIKTPLAPISNSLPNDEEIGEKPAETPSI